MDADTESDADADTAADTDSDPDADSDPYADSAADADADADSDTDTDADADADADSDTDTDDEDTATHDSGDGASHSVSTADVPQRLEDATDERAHASLLTEPAAVELTSAAVTDAVESAADPVPAPPWLAPRRTWNDVVAEIMTNWTTRHEAWVESLDVSDERKEELTASFLAMRRGLFNQAPTVAPIQLSGLVSGPITGDINGVDAEGDAIVYRLIRGPRQGSVVINADGTYTYTPDAEFDGVDTFSVRAIDVGLHINLLNLLRPIGTRSTNLINQGAITFDFAFTGDGWTDERREALQQVASRLQEYFRVDRAVTLSYDVNVELQEGSLASAFSPYISELPGYWPTVVQYKLQTGRDANGSTADGEITWNFKDYEWGLGETVSDDEYDFVSTAIHELMHSFGFLSSLDAPGENDDRNRAYFDRFVVTARGVRPFTLFGGWPAANDPKLGGEDGGLFFGGRNAIAAHGGLVPLYTPMPFEPGSSIAHLDDVTFTGDDQQIMNAQTGKGLIVRVFSDLELGLLEDLGYRVVMPQAPPYGMALIGSIFLARPRRKDKSAAR
ncbi:Ig-like domain-containing protein [Mycobacterium sp. DL]|uniref:Ig-like domain-containing protein n=1 Tax=Mycobacteriaceae TaxID=1762 RepID=UPI00321947F0